MRRRLAEQPGRAIKQIPLNRAHGRILAIDITADRDYPPFPRSMRDGFAVRAADLPGELTVIGEVRAGEPATVVVAGGQAVEIMTGAPVPEGADAILMVEHVHRSGSHIQTDRHLQPGDNIAPRGSEATKNQQVLKAGTKLDYAHIGAAATVGLDPVPVSAKTTVSIVATGDELVAVHEHPKDFQIRNSNSYSLAAQVQNAGGDVVYQTVAADNPEALRAAIDRAFEADIVLFSGGVSAGKYDLVEPILAESNAEFFFTRVLIQPGQPAVFGRARGKLFFGLPGNPVSTMVTFELFARLAIDGAPLPLSRARLSQSFRHKTGLTRFLPATVVEDTVTPVSWGGSGDVFSVARANAFLIAEADREAWSVGDTIRIFKR